MSQALTSGTLAAKGFPAMRTTFACLIASIVTAGAACTAAPTAPPLPPEVQALTTARTHFATPPRPTYSFTWKQSCFCGPDSLRPMRVSVANGTIASAVFVDTQLPVSDAIRADLKTIDGVFVMIQHAIDQDYDEVTVAYDSQVGYPRTMTLIQASGAPDSGMSLTLSDVTVAATPGGSGGGTGGDSGW
jgi:hypothetical protein